MRKNRKISTVFLLSKMEVDKETIIKGLFALLEDPAGLNPATLESLMNACNKVYDIIYRDPPQFSTIQEGIDWLESIIEEFFTRIKSQNKPLTVTSVVTSAFHEGCPLVDEINLHVVTVSPACMCVMSVFVYHFFRIDSVDQGGLRVRWKCEEDLLKEVA